MSKYCFVNFTVLTKENVESVYLCGSSKNLGNWNTNNAIKMTKVDDNTFKARKRFLIDENIEYKVLCTKRWDNVEKGIFNEEVENHHFKAIKGHFESIYIHFFK